MGLLDNLKNTINPVTIDQFKATIGKRGGPAAANRFAVTITPPTQGLLNLDLQSAAASALSGNFSLGGLVNDPRDINILCENCEIPGRLIQTGDYDAYDRNPRKYPTAVVEEDVTFTFILTNDYYVKKFFDRWMSSILDPVTNIVAYDSEYKTDVFIQQLDKKNTPIYGVRLLDAFPTSVNSIALGNDQSGDSIQTVTVSMTYNRFEVEGAIKSLVNSVTDKLGAFRRLI